MKNVIVAGGAGFLGSTLVDKLVKDSVTKLLVIDDLRLGKTNNIEHHDIAFWKKSVQIAFGVHAKAIDDFAPDTIFNLAVDPLPKSFDQPRTVWDNNVYSTWAIANYCIDKPIRMVQYSSSEVYGTALKGLIDESHELYPTTPYAASKAACDHLINSMVCTYDLDAVTIRPFNCIGPRQNDASYAGVIPLTIRRLQRGEAPEIHGTGQQSRDYAYSTDIAEAATAVAASGVRGRVYNACSGRETTIEWLIHEICEHMGYSGKPVRKPARQADVQRHIGDNRRLKDQTGWTPKVSIHEAVKRTVEWYQNDMVREK